MRFETDDGQITPDAEPDAKKSVQTEPPHDSEDDSLVKQLEDELRTSREELQSAIEELETSNEEFKATNEEVTSIVEEMQSTNEELETSKEELQSLNEELQTVNIQLEQKIIELESTNNDLANLLSSTEIATIFLDPQFGIKRFTPAATRLLRIIETDLGRPFTDLARNFTDDDLLTDAQAVLHRLTTCEKEVLDDAQRCYLRRIVPYRTQDNRIDGVVITFIDITQHKQDVQSLRETHVRLSESDATVREQTSDLAKADTAFRESEHRFRMLLESAPDALLVIDDHGQIAQVNLRTEELFGYGRSELIGQPVERLIPVRFHEQYYANRHSYFAAPNHRPMGRELRLVALRKNGTEFPVDIQLSPLQIEHHTLVMAAVRDMTERRQAEQVRSRLAAIMESSSTAIVMLRQDGTITHWNYGAELLLGYKAKELVGKTVARLLPPERNNDFQKMVARLNRAEPVEDYETVRIHKSGHRIDVAVTASLVEDGLDQTQSVSVILRDIRERKRLEQRIAEVADIERQHWSRELHDSLGQELSGISMLAAFLKQQLPIESPQANLAAQLETSADQTKQSLRRFAKGLFPVAVDANGLRVALKELAQEIAQVYQLDCLFECPDNLLLEDNFTATELFRIVREATHNAAKHAKPSQIVIRFENQMGVCVSIRDNGRGMPQVLDEMATLGLRIIRHRCSLIGANLQIETLPEGGTLIACRIPETRDQ